MHAEIAFAVIGFFRRDGARTDAPYTRQPPEPENPYGNENLGIWLGVFAIVVVVLGVGAGVKRCHDSRDDARVAALLDLRSLGSAPGYCRFFGID